MKDIRNEKQRILTLLMEAYGLFELFDILTSVCRNMPNSSVNTRSRHFGQFRLVLFGLTVKADGLLERMEISLEALKEAMPEYENVYQGVKQARRKVNEAHSMIKKNKIEEGKQTIIDAADDYTQIFKQIMELKDKL